MSARNRAPQSATLLGLSIIAACLAVLPIFLVDIPGLVDYPNHLARMRVLSDIGESAELSKIYSVNWAPIPNLAMDALIPQLAKLTGVFLATKIFLACSLLLIFTGTILLHKSIHDKLSLWPIVSVLFLYNHTFAYGFINYLFGIGVFLLVYRYWMNSDNTPSWRRTLVSSFLGFAIYFCHIWAFATYAACVALKELGHAVENCRNGKSLFKRRRQLLCTLHLIPPVVTYIAFAPSVHEGTFSVKYKAVEKNPAWSVIFYGPDNDVDLLIWSSVVLAIIYAVLKKPVRMSRSGVFPIWGLVTAFIITPTWMMDNYGNDFRLLVPLTFLFIAHTIITVPTGTMRVLISVVLGLTLLRGGSIYTDWRKYNELFDEVRHSAEGIAAGSRILPAVSDWSRIASFAPYSARRFLYNVPSLFVLESDVFVPTLFTATDRQPLSAIGGFAALDVPHSKPISVELLGIARDSESAPELEQMSEFGTHYTQFAGWPEKYDFVFIMDFGETDNPFPETLSLYQQGSFYTIYSVDQ